MEKVRCWPDLKAQCWLIDLAGTSWEEKLQGACLGTVAPLPWGPSASFATVKAHLAKLGFEAEYQVPRSA